MESSRFDQLARRLGAAQSRRRLITTALAVAGGAGITTAQAGAPASYSRVCRPLGAGCTRASQCCTQTCPAGRQLPRATRNRCACPAGRTACHGACVDLATNADHCGTCRDACNDGIPCVGGICVELVVCSAGTNKGLTAADC